MTSVAEKSEIRSFYEHTGVLITGATGFLGKVLIEKLLRSCHSVGTLYLLIRPKNEKSVNQRLEDLFDDVLFAEMKKANPRYKTQVQMVAGDCSLPHLGLHEDIYLQLQENVNIIFHGAATVRLDENLKLAVAINVHGTQEVINLSQSVKDLKALVCISTAYSNSHLSTIEEMFCDPPPCHQDIVDIAERSSQQEMAKLTPGLVGQWPNTYCLTKALAEHLIRQQQGVLPACVFRPAIVTSTHNEPLEGWIDNLYGPTGLMVGVVCGLVRVMHGDKSMDANLVPVDMTVNAMLAAAMDTFHRFRNGKTEMRVFNFVPSTANSIKFKDLIDVAVSNRYPTMRAVWCCSFAAINNYFLSLLLTLLLHFLPAIFFDAASVIMRRKPKMLQAYIKIFKYSRTISLFGRRNWFFRNGNVESLWQSLSRQDQEEFNFDIKSMDWNSYLDRYIKGLRVYLLKDDLKTLPEARKKSTRLYWCHQALKVACLGIFLKGVLTSTSFLWNYGNN